MRRLFDFLFNMVTRWQLGDEHFDQHSHRYTEKEARVARLRAALTPLEQLVQ